MQFNAIINQRQVKQQLVDLVQYNRLSHALLFLGKEGSGALPLALAFAQYIVCEKTSPQTSRKDEGVISLFGDEPVTGNQEPVTGNQQPATKNDSCGICQSCIRAKQLIHPDIHFSYPVVTRKAGTPPISTDYIAEWREFIQESPYGNVYDWLQFIGAENKQGNITAQECNDILRKLNLKSFESGYKIVILWMPEFLGKEGNKLLKLIEEPAADTLLILVAENEENILPTILSRCQLVKITALNTKDIEEALIAQHHTGVETIRQVAAVSDGNFRMAQMLVKDTDNDAATLGWQALLREWLNAILKTGPVAQAKWVEETARLGREKQKQFLRYFNYLLEMSIRVRILGKDDNLQGKERDFAERLNKLTGIEQQQAIVEELDRAAYYIERNANPKILFHALTIKLYHIIKDKIVFLTS